MIQRIGNLRGAALRMEGAAASVIEKYREGRVEHEPQITDRLLQAFEQTMDGHQVSKVKWRAKSLTSQGPHAQEARFGADFAGIFSADLPGFKVNKGFFAQAKRVEPGSAFPRPDYLRLSDQCRIMLNHTPDSFVFLYSRSGIRIVPAISIVSAQPRNPHIFFTRSVSSFFYAHFQSFIGDGQLSSPAPEMLEALRRKIDVRSLFYLQIRHEETAQ